VVLTSATLSTGGSLRPLAHRVGLRAELQTSDPEGEPSEEVARAGPEEAGPEEVARPCRELRVSSPFDYRNHALLYCAVHLPDPRRQAAQFDDAALEELAGLVEAAGGRTLALFTSHRMLRLAASAFAERFSWPVLVQDGPPEASLVERFRDDEQACLLATMGYWQGVDIPGPSLTLVAIDRLPFARPGDPLMDARREAARNEGRDAFEAVDLPLAATLLAQGAGRLIRTTSDRGVVAVLDRRLARAGYKRAFLDSLPPMRRTVDGDEVRRFLSAATTAPGDILAPASAEPA
jgi:ATP-dependent DNA helicase DinG